MGKKARIYELPEERANDERDEANQNDDVLSALSRDLRRNPSRAREPLRFIDDMANAILECTRAKGDWLTQEERVEVIVEVARRWMKKSKKR